MSGNIDEATVSILRRLHQVLSAQRIPFFIVGATARDILLDAAHGIGSTRTTIDIDIAVFVESWDRFKRIKGELTRSADFVATRETQRLLFRNQLPLDIVPFDKADRNPGERVT